MNAVGKMENFFAPVALLVVCTILLSLPGCKIVRRDQQVSGSPGVSENFDPVAYVATIWEPKVLPLFETKAVDIGQVIDLLKKDPDQAGKQFGHRPDVEGSAWNFVVKGTGHITVANTESKAGTLEIALESGNKVTLQIGPVIRGSAIRDVLPFFSFKDVTNQIEFSQVSRALNDQAMANVKAALSPVPTVGSIVEFRGAFTFSSPDKILVTPLFIQAGKP